MKTPCEVVVWYILPPIRRELTKCMMEDYGLSQKEAAEKLGLSSAAVSQYLSDKRGKGKIGLINEEVLNQIKKSAKSIIDGNDAIAIKEICRVCEMLRSKGIERMGIDG
jgi:hypothetical protein